MLLTRPTRLPRLLACILLWLAASAWAQPQALRLAFSELEPWMTQQDGRYAGAYTEIVRELARRLGLPLQVIDCPFKRCLKLMEVGEADLIIGARQSPQRMAYLHYLATPYRRTSADRVFILRADDPRRPGRYEDLSGLRIGVASGSDYFARFDADTTLLKDTAPNNESSLRKLLLGRVDCIVLPEDQALALLGQLGVQDQVALAPLRVADRTPRAIALSRRSPLLNRLPAIERAMRELREDGTLAAIYDRHYYQRYRVSRQRLPID